MHRTRQDIRDVGPIPQESNPAGEPIGVGPGLPPWQVSPSPDDRQVRIPPSVAAQLTPGRVQGIEPLDAVPELADEPDPRAVVPPELIRAAIRSAGVTGGNRPGSTPRYTTRTRSGSTPSRFTTSAAVRRLLHTTTRAARSPALRPGG